MNPVCRSPSANGKTLWIGTANGSALLDLDPNPNGDKWRYFGGDRWLAGGPQIVSVGAVDAPDDASTELSLPAAWVVTATGAALISSMSMTLEAKAAAYLAR